MRMLALTSLSLLVLACAVSTARAELKLPAIIGDHMVLQQKQANPIWGWDNPGAKVTVAFAGQTHTATAGADGRWTVKLAALEASTEPRAGTMCWPNSVRSRHSDVAEMAWARLCALMRSCCAIQSLSCRVAATSGRQCDYLRAACDIARRLSRFHSRSFSTLRLS